MQKILKLPIGINDFTMIRTRDYIYVDKTKQIEKLIRSGERYFLARPSGFGKSLTLSTIECVFSGKTELFKDLAAYEFVQEFSNHPHPIIHIDLASLDTRNLVNHIDFEKKIDRMINALAKKFKIEVNDLPFDEKLSNLIIELYENRGYVVILIDNYDQPILKCIHNSKLVLKIYDILNRFYTTIDLCNKYICFLIIVGETKYHTTGVFSTLRAINDISTNKKFADLFGYTYNEIENNYNDFINENNFDQRYILKSLKDLSNEFCFDGETNVYNQAATLAYLESGNLKKYISYVNEKSIDISQYDASFLEAKNNTIYVDKSELLIYTNNFICTNKKYICISRPRRFGKTISADMVAAYYDRDSDAKTTFSGLKITSDPSFSQYANQYIVIKITIQDYLSKIQDIDLLVEKLKSNIIFFLLQQYGTNYSFEDLNSVMI